mmetsp:Transcript_33062/g.112241  ORF Transcript_33062/g.112241 Transcript_33062/m.112241 type:complete len:228 (-) Transcript_33062:611-1294(-)
MVRPPTRQLSALKLPWQKPTRNQPAAKSASASRARAAKASAAVLSSSSPTSASIVASVSSRCSSSRSGYSRAIACCTISLCSRFADAAAPRPPARRAKWSTWPTRTKDGATRQVMAQVSSTMTSGSPPPAPCCWSWRMSWRRSWSGNWARRGSSSLISGTSACRPLYQGRRVVSPPETTSDKALVVSTPRKCIASDARNSRSDDRSTARPSAPRQKGVWPPPLSWSS